MLSQNRTYVCRIRLESDVYLLTAIRYVHQNPQKAGICRIEEYIWSSYGEYKNGKVDLIEINEILDMFSMDRRKAVEEFVKFNNVDAWDKLLDIEEEKEIDEIKVREYIGKYLNERGLDSEQLRNSKNKKEREEIIRLLVEKTNLSLREIAKELGLNREMVRRATLSKEPSP